MFQQIKYFQAVVETNSFTEAAEQCHISQSAISQQMKALENELGVKLVERKGRKFTVTEAGQYFYEKSLILLANYEQIVKDIKKIENKDNYKLRIGYISDYTGNEFEQALNDFSEKYPNIELDIVSGTHESLYELLKNDQLDIALNDQRRAFSNLYENRELIKIPYSIEISQRNPLSKKAFIDVEDLKEQPCILACSKDQQENEKTYYQTYFGIKSPFLFAESNEAAHMLIVQNKGYKPIVEKESHFGTILVPLYQNGKPIYRKYCIFWKLDNSGYFVEEFGDILESKYK